MSISGKQTLVSKHKIEIFLSAIMILLIFLSNFSLSSIETFSSDSAEYLQAGENLFSGKGFVTTFNKYHGWNGVSFPWLPYGAPIYPVLCGFFLLFGNLQALVLLNILFWAGSVVLMYRILRLRMEILPAFLIALILGFTPEGSSLSWSAITEQLHLFLVLSAIYIFLRNEQKYRLAGILLIAGSFVRVAGIYNVMAFCLFLAGAGKSFKDSSRRALQVFILLLLTYGIYELFCFLKYGMFYPQYPLMCRIHVWSQVFPGGVYAPGPHPLQISDAPIGAGFIWQNISGHLRTLIKDFGCLTPIILIGAICPISDVLKKGDALIGVLWMQALTLLLIYPLSLWWYPLMEAHRYGIISYLFFTMLGLFYIKMFMDRAAGHSKWGRGLNFLFLFSLLIFVFVQHVQFVEDYKEKDKSKSVYHADLKQTASWIQNSTPEEALIVTDNHEEVYVFKRRVIDLPRGFMETEPHFRDFTKAFRPDYIVSSYPEWQNFLREKGLKEVFQNRSFSVFEFRND